MTLTFENRKNIRAAPEMQIFFCTENVYTLIYLLSFVILATSFKTKTMSETKSKGTLSKCFTCIEIQKLAFRHFYLKKITVSYFFFFGH